MSRFGGSWQLASQISLLTLCGLTAGCSLEGEAPVTTNIQLTNTADPALFSLNYAIGDGSAEATAFTAGIAGRTLATDETDAFNVESVQNAFVDVQILVDTGQQNRTYEFSAFPVTISPYGELEFTYRLDPASSEHIFEHEYR